jgi:hypothetical protein
MAVNMPPAEFFTIFNAVVHFGAFTLESPF